MGLLGIPFSIPTQILPNFLIAVAVCDSVHVLAIFFQAIDRGQSRADSIAYALGHSGLAVVLTSLTTAGGLLSFLAAEITPVARLGTIAPIGVMITLFYTLTFLPALLSVIPLSSRAHQRKGLDDDELASGASAGMLDRAMLGFGDWVATHPKRVLFVGLLVVLVATTGVSKLRFSHDPFDFLLPGDAVRIAVQRMDEGLRGVSTVEVLVDTGKENGLYDPDVLRRLEAVAQHAMSIDEGPIRVGGVISIVDIVKEIHQALHANDPNHYRLPKNRKLIAQELLLFENSGSDDLLQVTDSRFQIARLTLRVPLTDGFYYGAFLDDLTTDLEGILGPDLDFELTGATVLGSRAFTVVITSMARSYALALMIITPLMIVMIGSVRIGLLSMLPNLIPVYLVLALMGWLDISLNMSTLLVGSFVIGLAVDDTIHFLHQFDRYYRSEGDPRAAVRRTLQFTGRALLVTTVVLVISFGINGFGRMTGVVTFGLLAGFGCAVAFIADLTLSPALLVLAFKKQRSAP